MRIETVAFYHREMEPSRIQFSLVFVESLGPKEFTPRRAISSFYDLTLIKMETKQ